MAVWIFYWVEKGGNLCRQDDELLYFQLTIIRSIKMIIYLLFKYSLVVENMQANIHIILVKSAFSLKPFICKMAINKQY